jgi:hypothetical protein
MNIFEEYASRKKISYPIAYHVDSSVLILKADNNKRWACNWCVLSVLWHSNPHHPGFYKIQLSSPIHSLESQSLFYLNKSHFSIDKSWFEYEKFFYQWNPRSKGLSPVFGDDAILAAWEIFVCSNEKHFLNQSLFVKDSLYDTLNPNASTESRIASCHNLVSSGRFSLSDVWKEKFLSTIENCYLNWFKFFVDYEYAKL